MTDSSRRVKAETNSSKVALFFLWFNLINFCFPRVGICRDNQGIVNVEEADKLDKSIVVEKQNIRIVGVEEVNGAEDSDTSTINVEEAERANNTSTANVGVGGADNIGIANVEDKDKTNTGIANIKDVDKSDTGTTNVKNADKLDIGTADTKDTD